MSASWPIPAAETAFIEVMIGKGGYYFARLKFYGYATFALFEPSLGRLWRLTSWNALL